jgi:3'-phosphoadenosine 5'-phosphosulfate (PAPS) 3'-phosphatase
MTLARELEVASALAREAGALVVAIRDRGPAALGVEHKAGDEPVTVADRAASELIVAGLAAAFPDDVIVSEESADDLARLGASRVWFVDPIDGTKDFIRGTEGFAVMIGLCVDARPVARRGLPADRRPAVRGRPRPRRLGRAPRRQRRAADGVDGRRGRRDPPGRLRLAPLAR